MRYQAIRSPVTVIHLSGHAQVTDSLGISHDVKVGDTLPTGSVLILDIDASAELAPIGLNNKDSDQKTK